MSLKSVIWNVIAIICTYKFLGEDELSAVPVHQVSHSADVAIFHRIKHSVLQAIVVPTGLNHNHDKLTFGDSYWVASESQS